jgi:aspartate/methionine/tyrosine aminotransferase
VVVAPGSYLGESGEGYVRLALVPDDDACRRAAAIIEEVV